MSSEIMENQTMLSGRLDQDIKNRIILIVIVAIIFILSIGVIMWIIRNNSETDDYASSCEKFNLTNNFTRLEKYG